MVLDFEKPIVELEEKLEEMKRVAAQNKVDVSGSAEELERKIVDLKRNIYSNLSRWQRVQLARHPQRPYSMDYIRNICDVFYELSGDRAYGDDKAIVGGLAEINGEGVMILGHQKGRDTKSRQYRNFGMANPEGYRKALRLIKLAEKFRKPVVTLIDTPGAYPGLEAEERGQAEAIARNLLEMSRARTPIICIVIGEGASGGALGIGVGDRIYMMENTWYSVISPESCSSILWRNWNHKEDAAEALKLSAQDNLELGLRGCQTNDFTRPQRLECPKRRTIDRRPAREILQDGRGQNLRLSRPDHRATLLRTGILDRTWLLIDRAGTWRSRCPPDE
jgi:acetyl-CoA carboxylase carboxyl transferase subunit alpha